MIFFSGMILLFKKITLMGVKPAVLLLFVSIFLFIFYLSHTTVTKTPTKINNYILILIIIAAFLSYLANLFYTKSIALAPNAGYSAAIISLQLAVITIASIILFGAEFSLIRGVGVLLAIIAGILLSI